MLRAEFLQDGQTMKLLDRELVLKVISKQLQEAEKTWMDGESSKGSVLTYMSALTWLQLEINSGRLDAVVQSQEQIIRVLKNIYQDTSDLATAGQLSTVIRALQNTGTPQPQDEPHLAAFEKRLKEMNQPQPSGELVEALRDAIKFVDGVADAMPNGKGKEVRKLSDQWVSVLASEALSHHQAGGKSVAECLADDLERIADMKDRDGNCIDMHRDELRGIARRALTFYKSTLPNPPTREVEK